MQEWLEWGKKQGLATLLVLVGVGVFAGYIPSPLKTTADYLSQHVVQMDNMLREQRYQTALLATVCFKLVSTQECMVNLMKEHVDVIPPTEESAPSFRQADPRLRVTEK